MLTESIFTYLTMKHGSCVDVMALRGSLIPISIN